MSDKVSLHGIAVYAHHGVLAAERELGQRFVIDVEMWADCTPAALGDDLSQALDYSLAHRVVSETVVARSFQLLETLAGEICRSLLEKLPAQKVQVRVEKVQPPIANFLGTAAVTLVRDRTWLKTKLSDGSV
ncbi:MAG: dihydroneopterin aldolase [Candidatus Krumholzibacteriia bacterium]|jgi:dihydroneopterin aldolase